MKRLIAALLSIVILSLLFSSCSFKSSEKDMLSGDDTVLGVVDFDKKLLKAVKESNPELSDGISVKNNILTVELEPNDGCELIIPYEALKTTDWTGYNKLNFLLENSENDSSEWKLKVKCSSFSVEVFKRNKFGAGCVTSAKADLSVLGDSVNDIKNLTFKFGASDKKRTVNISDIYLESGTYLYETNNKLQCAFGWEGDVDAPIAFIDGSFRLRDGYDHIVSLGIRDIASEVYWYNSDGYLPCFVSLIEKDNVEYAVSIFANKHTVNGNDYEIVYCQMTVDNKNDSSVVLPKVSGELIPLNESAKNDTYVPARSVSTREYAICADRFGGDYAYPSREEIASLGSFEENYEAMKTYWNNRLEPLSVIKKLPNSRLIDAYKAGYIYTLIIADGYSLNIGENGYDQAFDHDIIGILTTLVTIGDYKNFFEYSEYILANVMYPDARWKFNWPFATYLSKTGDYDGITAKFDTIKSNTHYIEAERDLSTGIMMNTNAIDSDGAWLTDNWSALMGLTSYGYICDRLYEHTGDAQYSAESNWAKALYDELLKCTEKTQKQMREKYDYPYLSIDMKRPTEESARSDERDANWASMFLFGRWAWDGYLFGADQEGSDMISLIDDTYSHGFERRAGVSDSIYNFGGYPHGYYCSSYNAGYGSSALRGEQYRDAGIKAYEFMINNAMSGPFGWWEGIDSPNEGQWAHSHAAAGGGSCQHMWGQSTATKVLFDSLIAEKIGEKIIIGRGIPAEWIADGEEIELDGYTVEQGKKIGYSISTVGKTVTVKFTGDATELPLSIELIAFKNGVKSTSVGDIDAEKGIVTVPGGTKEVIIESN